MASTHVFVRPATSLDAKTIGKIQAETMKSSLEAAIGGELPAEVNQMLAPQEFAAAWDQAISTPPSPEHTVLTAVDEGTIVGFAALSPTQPQPIDGAHGAQVDAQDGGPVVVEITALEVPLENGRAGHGSRLLAAATDLARERGATAVQMWVLAGDDAHTSFLHEAGFEPTGLRRTMDVGSHTATQHCWYAALPDEE